MANQMLNIPEVAKRLRITPKTLRRGLHSGAIRLPVLRHDPLGPMYVSEKDLDRYIADNSRPLCEPEPVAKCDAAKGRSRFRARKTRAS